MSAQLNHDQAFELLPWLVNGTLTGSELDSVETHVRDCVTCRLALREQQQLRAAIQQHPTVSLSAEQDFGRLLHRLDTPSGEPSSRRARGFSLFEPSWARAAVAAAGLAAIGLTAWIAVTIAVDRDDAGFVTLARKTTVEDVRLDIIFATSVAEADMRMLLNEMNGTIVGGPSDLGRYTVRLNATSVTTAEVDELIERLGDDQRIRFAGRSMIEEQGK